MVIIYTVHFVYSQLFSVIFLDNLIIISAIDFRRQVYWSTVQGPRINDYYFK